MLPRRQEWGKRNNLHCPSYQGILLSHLFFIWILQIFGAAPKFLNQKIWDLLGTALQAMLIEWGVRKSTFISLYLYHDVYLYTRKENLLCSLKMKVILLFL